MAPRQLIGATPGPFGYPKFELWEGDKCDMVVDCIIVVTDILGTPGPKDENGRITLDRQHSHRGGGKERWFSRAGGVDGPTHRWNEMYRTSDHVDDGFASEAAPAPGRVVDTTGGDNENHRVVIMANIIEGHKYPNAHLRAMYHRILTCAMALPPFGALFQPAWRCSVTSIAFEVLGAFPMSWTAEDAAEHALRAIDGRFNDEKHGEERQYQIRTVMLLVPAEKARNSPDIEAAWKKAWNRWVVGTPESRRAEKENSER